MQIRYPAHIEQQSDGSFFVQFIDLPDTFTEGASLEEALFNASEVLSAMLGWHLDTGSAIPAPGKKVKNAYDITPDAKTQSALLLKQTRGNRSLAELARALDTSWPVAKRLEDTRRWPSLRAIDRAASALGKKLVLSFE